jgi:hypothetical protein
MRDRQPAAHPTATLPIKEIVMRKFNGFIALVLSAALSTGCATGPKVRVDKDPGADMAAYKTFAFFEPAATDQARYSTLMTGRLKDATRSELERLGYTYDERAPQLRVNFFLNIIDKQELRSATASAGGFYRYRSGSYRAWSSYPYDIETVNYQAGTLGVDLVDVGTKALVWQGVAEGRVPKEAYRNPGQAVDAVVAELFRNFPNPPAR